MNYSYKIQCGASACEMSFSAPDYYSKPTSQLSGSGSPEAKTILAIMMAESSSVGDFEKKVEDSGATAWNEVPNYKPSETTSTSSGMSWGSSASSDEDDE